MKPLMSGLRRLCVAALCVGLAMSCAAPEVSPAPVPRQPYATVLVQNENFYMARVYSKENGNTQVPLCRVETNITQACRLFIHPGAAYAFVITLVGAPAAYTTENIQVSPGDTVRLGVAPFIRQTRLWMAE